jgi:hypothetical protein
VRRSELGHQFSGVTKVSVGPNRDRWFVRGVSRRDTIELSSRMTEDNVSIRDDGTGSIVVSAGNDDRVDAVFAQDAGNGAQRRIGAARDDTDVHHVSDRHLLALDSWIVNAATTGRGRAAYDGCRVAMEQYVIAARLKPGQAAEAERKLASGPPFDPAEVGLSAHAAFLTDRDVYLVFEGEAAHSTALQLARAHLVEVSRWQAITTGLPARVDAVPAEARCLYEWRAVNPPEP